ncbi:MAG: Lrp/AsnC ligand binding domain-containing protein [Candidatus Caldarchaeum sp.]|nr:Lrp/AsnC ligand binding domain-containing protein [Candidatus Caldarchaeum sp.]MDW8359263.1 Lrp/AsnC ligand binding domain-containing protein [Candidatus Caldarchaeum sp.]
MERYMPIAFLLLNVKLGHEDDVINALKSIKEVRYAQRVYGVYDTVVKVEADSMEALKQVVNSKIKRIENITSVVSLIVMG